MSVKHKLKSDSSQWNFISQHHQFSHSNLQTLRLQDLRLADKLQVWDWFKEVHENTENTNLNQKYYYQFRRLSSQHFSS